MHDVSPNFAPSPAFVAQWIEQRFPKPKVACSIHADLSKGRDLIGTLDITWAFNGAIYVKGGSDG